MLRTNRRKRLRKRTRKKEIRFFSHILQHTNISLNILPRAILQKVHKKVIIGRVLYYCVS